MEKDERACLKSWTQYRRSQRSTGPQVGAVVENYNSRAWKDKKQKNLIEFLKKEKG